MRGGTLLESTCTGQAIRSLADRIVPALARRALKILLVNTSYETANILLMNSDHEIKLCGPSDSGTDSHTHAQMIILIGTLVNIYSANPTPERSTVRGQDLLKRITNCLSRNRLNTQRWWNRRPHLSASSAEDVLRWRCIGIGTHFGAGVLSGLGTASSFFFRLFLRKSLRGSNAVFQERVREITGGKYPFKR